MTIVSNARGYAAAMSLRTGSHKLGPADGSLQVHTFREGVAQKVGHDLIFAVTQWEATVEVQDGELAQVGLDADGQSLEVREGLGGLKPLTDRDRKEILGNVDDKVLRRQPITFRSSSVQQADGQLTLAGELTLAGTTRPATFDLSLADDGRLKGTLSVVQSEWGIKPYRGLMGALKVRDAVDIVLDVALPAG